MTLTEAIREFIGQMRELNGMAFPKDEAAAASVSVCRPGNGRPIRFPGDYAPRPYFFRV